VNLNNGTPVFTYFLVGDNNNVIALADESGTVTDRYEYSAFGTLLNYTGTDPNRILFSAEPNDEDSGLIYLRNRYYDAEMGRFVSRDLLFPYGANNYIYCRNNPVLYTDPTGYDTFVFYNLPGDEGDMHKLIAEHRAKELGVKAELIESYEEMEKRTKGKLIDRLIIVGHGSPGNVYFNTTPGSGGDLTIEKVKKLNLRFSKKDYVQVEVYACQSEKIAKSFRDIYNVKTLGLRVYGEYSGKKWGKPKENLPLNKEGGITIPADYPKPVFMVPFTGNKNDWVFYPKKP
jgi:RHS repeat-associated protein